MQYLAKFLTGVGAICILAVCVGAYLYFNQDSPLQECRSYVAEPGSVCRGERMLVSNGLVAMCACPSGRTVMQ